MTPPNPPTPQSVSSTGTGELLDPSIVPPHLIDMAHEIDLWMRREGHERWQLGPIASRNLVPATPPKMNAGETPSATQQQAPMNPTTRRGRLALEAALQEQTLAEQAASNVHAPHLTHLQHEVPTDGTTTPRTDRLTVARGEPLSGLIWADDARKIEKELNWFERNHRLLEEGLALTEKRLGEAQGEREDLLEQLKNLQNAYLLVCEAIGLPDSEEGQSPKEMATLATDLRAQLATSQARLVEVEASAKHWRKNAVHFNEQHDEVARQLFASNAKLATAEAALVKKTDEFNQVAAQRGEALAALVQAKQEARK